MSKATSIFWIGGGLATIGAVFLAVKKSNETTEAISDAVDGTGKNLVQLRLTGYWPFAATDAEKKMEGGLQDRKGQPLHTVEDYLAGKADFVSLSGDDAIWPYGQRVNIPWTDGKTILGRVVDTGSHFRGANKVYRLAGTEPIDVCVASSATVVPKVVTAQIVAGDNNEKGKSVAVNKLKDQTVLTGTTVLGGDFTDEDYEEMFRASKKMKQPTERLHIAGTVGIVELLRRNARKAGRQS